MAAAAPAAAASPEAPAVSGSADPETGDEDSREVRVLQSLRGRIYEAKNLLPYLGPNKMRDCFCTINLDQEEVYRTQVVEKSLSPYFSEEFYFEIPRTFQYLSFYVYDKNVLQRDLRIGKVAIKKEDLCSHSGKETWFSLHHNKLVPFITAVAELDLKDTPDANAIFRGNSLATQCLTEMMKIVGGHYLKVTLKPVLDEICESSKSCEIDPVKLKEGDNVENNKENLYYYVDKVFNTIVGSSVSCPTVMCDIFYSLRQMAAKKFPNHPHVQYSAVSSFVFLRFFAVAILSPHAFHLRPHYPDTQTVRTLTLISKYGSKENPIVGKIS